MNVEAGRGDWMVGKRNNLNSLGKGFRPRDEAHLGPGSGTTTCAFVIQFPQL